MPTREEEAILRTVAYASVFQYPLTLGQLQQSLKGTRLGALEILSIYGHSAPLRDAIEHRDGLFFLRGCEDHVAERSRREIRTATFLAEHRRLLRWAVALPFVELVALSGSVAHRNLDEAGDLDVFVVTRGARVWSVTVTLLLVAMAMRCRRTLCVNFVVADSRLRLRQVDEFTASQVIALKPLAGAEVFRRFIEANPEVHDWYPNFRADLPDEVPAPAAARALRRLVESRWLRPVAAAYERLCRAAYRRHLERRAQRWTSPDQVELGADYLKLHTHSHRTRVQQRFATVLAAVDACGAPAHVRAR
jgi:hypothetical protein